MEFHILFGMSASLLSAFCHCDFSQCTLQYAVKPQLHQERTISPSCLSVMLFLITGITMIDSEALTCGIKNSDE